MAKRSVSRPDVAARNQGRSEGAQMQAAKLASQAIVGGKGSGSDVFRDGFRVGAVNVGAVRVEPQHFKTVIHSDQAVDLRGAGGALGGAEREISTKDKFERAMDEIRRNHDFRYDKKFPTAATREDDPQPISEYERESRRLAGALVDVHDAVTTLVVQIDRILIPEPPEKHAETERNGLIGPATSAAVNDLRGAANFAEKLAEFIRSIHNRVTL